MGAMKDSGIEWIGEIPVEWDVRRILYVLEQPITDGPHTTPDMMDEGIPFVSAEAVSTGNGSINFDNIWGYISEAFYQECCKKYIPRKDDIYMIKSGATTGKVSIVDTNKIFTIWSPLAVVRCDRALCFPKFMYYSLQADFFQMQVQLGWTYGTQQNIGMRTLEHLKICIPPIIEQQAIAKFLDTRCAKIDDVIADITKQIELLQQYKKSLITETVTKGLDKSVSMMDSGVEWIGKVGKGWKAKRLKYVLDKKSNNIKVGPFGTALSADDIRYEGYWLYNQRCVLDNNFIESDAYIDEKKYKELIGFKVYEGDLLITTRGTIGRVAIVPNNPPNGVLHPCIIRFVVDNKQLLNEYVKYIFNETEIVSKQLSIKSNATTIDVIYSYNLKDVFLPIAPITEQKRIVSFLDKKCAQIDSILESKRKQLETITEHKKSLIYEYVTGKKRVKEVQ